jgi:hypothetical protein
MSRQVKRKRLGGALTENPAASSATDISPLVPSLPSSLPSRSAMAQSDKLVMAHQLVSLISEDDENTAEIQLLLEQFSQTLSKQLDPYAKKVSRSY